MLFPACADQLLLNLSLIKLCLACVKQNTAVKTAWLLLAIDAFSLLAKQAFLDLAGGLPSSFINNFE